MYKPAEYWERRLNDDFNLRGVGHQSYSLRYNQWLYKRKRQVLGLLFKELSLTDKTVLDIGCGTGFFVEWYRNQGAKVDGIDISQKSVSELTKNFPESSFLQMDFSAPNLFLTNQYEVINVWDVIYHQTDNASFLQFLKNCAQVCVENGRIIFTDAFGMPHANDTADHVRFRNKDEYLQPMYDLGFLLKQEIPLYRFLNRSAQNRLSRLIQESLAPLFYQLDKYQKNLAKNNLSVTLWAKEV